MKCRQPNKPFLQFIAVTTLAASTLAQAQPSQLKPGLWEISSKANVAGMAAPPMPDMQAMLQKMPPEQRKQMEAMMAKQGIAMGNANGGSSKPGYTTVRVCLTADHFRQGALNQPASRNDCIHKAEPAVGNSMKFSFTCTNPKAEGQGQATWSGDNRFSNQISIRSEHQGKMQQTDMDSTGTWLGADCGSVRPLPLGPAGKS